MNYNLFTKELKRNRLNLFIWSGIVVGFTFLLLGIFPSMEAMGEDINQMMEKLPAELGKALGMDKNTWSNILGFYSTYYGIYIILLVSIYTMSTGAVILSKEEKDGTAEFLLTKPISRKSIFWTKMASLITLTMIIYVVQTAFAILGFSIFGGGSVNWSGVAIMHAHGLVLVFFFTTLGVLLSMFFRPKKNFMGMVVGIVFGSYLIDALSKASESIEWLGYLSPFHYLSFTVTSQDYALNALPVIFIPILGLAVLWFAFRVFLKKDIAG